MTAASDNAVFVMMPCYTQFNIFHTTDTSKNLPIYFIQNGLVCAVAATAMISVAVEKQRFHFGRYSDHVTKLADTSLASDVS